MSLRRIVLVDAGGNGARYALDAPEPWTAAGLRDYLALPAAEAAAAGHLARPADPRRHETLRELVNRPGETLNPPVVFAGTDHLLADEEPVGDSVVLARRLPATPTPPDADAVDLAARNRRIFAACEPTLTDDIARALGWPDWRDRPALALLHRAARVLHAAPFENVSRLLAGVGFRPGHEMWALIADGRGGVCSEKTAALQFLADVQGWTSRCLYADRNPLAASMEEDLEQTVTSGGAHPFRHRLTHMLLEVDIDGAPVLVDATGGNLALLMLDADDAQRRLARGLRARTVYEGERLHLRRTTRRFSDLQLTLSTYHAPAAPLELILGHGLGLYVGRALFVGAYLDYGTIRAARMQQHFARRAQLRRLPPPRFLDREALAAWDDPLAAPLRPALDALRDAYTIPHYTGDFGLVVQPLPPFNGLPPVQISPSLRARLERTS